MAVFQYRALPVDGGAMTQGQIEAGGRQEAFRLIEAKGLKPVSLKESSGGSIASAAKEAANKSSFNISFGSKKVGFKELENFIRQLSGLLAAGVPLSRALKLLSREAASGAAQEQWKNIYDLVIDGTGLADAMARYPETFPKVTVAMVQAGEMGGFLDVVLNQIAEFQARDKELRGKVTAALVYPAVLLFLAIGVLIFLLTFFIPRFEPMFASLGGSLPTITLVILKVSHIVSSAWALLVLGVIIAIAIGVKRWLSTTAGQRAWQQTILKLPVFGPLASRFALARFSRMLGTLLAAGVPLINGLKTACDSIGNQVLMDAVKNAIERVRQGDRLAASLGDCPQLFPSGVVEIIAVAEETGRLDKELQRMAEMTESDLERQLRMAVSLAEPVLLFMMAAFIGTIFVGMVLPIFTIQDLVK